MTVVAEKIFKLTNDEQLQAVQAERQGIFGLQMNTIQGSGLLRTVNTPAKVKAGKWNDA